MTIENGPFEDIFPIENGDFPLSIAMLVYRRVVLCFNCIVFAILSDCLNSFHNPIDIQTYDT